MNPLNIFSIFDNKMIKNVELNKIEKDILNICSEFSSIMENLNLMFKKEKGEFFIDNEGSSKLVSNLMRVKEDLHQFIDKIYIENNNKVLLNKTFENEEILNEIDALKKKYIELKNFVIKRNR